MRILVVGAGAMGCLFASYLKKAGHDVSLLEILPDRVERINLQGIRVEGVRGRHTVKVPAYAVPPSIEPELAIVCVKAYDTLRAARDIREVLRQDTQVLTLQNGLGNVEILAEVLGGERVLGGVTAEGATLLGPGRIRHAGQGSTILQAGPEVEAVVAVFRAAGFQARAEARIQDFIWGKLLVNAGINALTAVTRLRNGRLPELEGSRQIMEAAVAEAVAVAKAAGVSIPFPDPWATVVEVCRNTAGNVASMLQDVLKQQPTEIAFINGAIVREGKRLGVPTPVNATLASLVTVIQETYQERVN
ncbi:MAG: 2-dehydropantoate 2-reductase [Thermodesulfobacteriota bacterium]